MSDLALQAAQRPQMKIALIIIPAECVRPLLRSLPHSRKAFLDFRILSVMLHDAVGFFIPHKYKQVK
jgi:hypothetical protein